MRIWGSWFFSIVKNGGKTEHPTFVSSAIVPTKVSSPCLFDTYLRLESWKVEVFGINGPSWLHQPLDCPHRSNKTLFVCQISLRLVTTILFKLVMVELFFLKIFSVNNPIAAESVVLFETVTCLLKIPLAEEISFLISQLPKEQLLLSLHCVLYGTSERPTSIDTNKLNLEGPSILRLWLTYDDHFQARCTCRSCGRSE